MFKTALIFLFLFLVGCTSLPKPVPKSAPLKFCGENETVNCQPLTPGMKEGSSRGHGDEPKNDQMMFYKPPEELWPDDFPPAPKVCGSPFQGKLIAR